MTNQGLLPRIRTSPYHGSVPDLRTARSAPSSRKHHHITDKELRP